MGYEYTLTNQFTSVQMFFDSHKTQKQLKIAISTLQMKKNY